MSSNIKTFITSILKSQVILAIGLAQSDVIYSRIALFCALNCIFFSTNEKVALKQNNQSDFKDHSQYPIKLQEKKSK